MSYLESSAGDLSNNRNSPTTLTLSVGDNVIDGNHGAGDLDYVAVTLPANVILEQIIVDPTTTFAGTRSFIGVAAGPTMPVDPANPQVNLLLGYAHFDFGSLGADILAEIGLGGGSQMFIPPLGAGAVRTYTFWIQETGTTTAHYKFNFKTRSTANVPELGTAGFLALAGALGWLGIRRARRLGKDQTHGSRFRLPY